MKEYQPVVYSDWCLSEYFPKMNWQVSVSVDQLNFADKTPYKVYWQVEPEDIRPLKDKVIANQDFYDLILAWDEKIVGYCKNAVLFPFGGTWAKETNVEKQFKASFLVSSKVMCLGHSVRQGIFNSIASQVGRIEIVKHKSPPFLANKSDMLAPYQFSIIMENSQSKNWFTEKLIDCMINKTIPIYWGAPNISEFFNSDGIIGFNDRRDLTSLLESLTPETYSARLAAVEDNYKRALTYANPYVRIVEAVTKAWQRA